MIKYQKGASVSIKYLLITYVVSKLDHNFTLRQLWNTKSKVDSSADIYEGIHQKCDDGSKSHLKVHKGFCICKPKQASKRGNNCHVLRPAITI